MNTRTPGNRYPVPIIPVPVPISYDELRRCAVKGESVGAEIGCARCPGVGTLVYTGRSVERGAVLRGEGGALDPQTLWLPLARCADCKARIRVLPRELLSFKSFSLPVIEEACRRYLDADPEGSGLRRTVCGMGKYAPAHSTLWQWLAGLGERALDQGAVQKVPAYRRLPPASSLIAESDKRLGKKLGRFWQRHFKIPWWKYRSEKRREQLEGCARVLGAARELFAEPLHPFSEWHGRLIEWLDVAGWAFPTGMSCTDMELTARPSGGVPSAPNSKPAKGGRCHGARSPP